MTHTLFIMGIKSFDLCLNKEMTIIEKNDYITRCFELIYGIGSVQSEIMINEDETFNIYIYEEPLFQIVKQ